MRKLASTLLILSLLVLPIGWSLSVQEAHAAAQWQNVTIDNTKVPGDLTDFPVYIDLADLDVAGSDFWDLTNCTDIRVFKSDGTTELAREIVDCDVGTKTGELHVKYSGTLSSTVDTEIQIHYDGTSSDYAVGATYGRNAVWSDYLYVYHLEETSGNIIDSAGNGPTLTAAGGAGPAAAKLGNGGDFDGSSSYAGPSGSVAPGPASGSYSWQMWYKADFYGSDDMLAGSSNAGGAPNRTSNFTGSAGTWYMTHAIWNGSNNIDSYVDGSLANGTYTSGSSDQRYWGSRLRGSSQGLMHDFAGVGTGFFAVGARPNNLSQLYFDGLVDEIRVTGSGNDVSPNWITTEYNNQSSPGTFYSVSAEQDEGGSGDPSPQRKRAIQVIGMREIWHTV